MGEGLQRAFKAVSDQKKQAEAERRRLPSLTPSEVIIHFAEGRRVFHNGGERQRIALSVSGQFVYYRTKSAPNRMTVVLLSNFASWAKGVVEK